MKLAIALVFAACASAFAGTHRVAIVVGNNVGNGDRPALHYAETDASKFADVLLELGGVAPADLALLQGKDLAALDAALARAKQRIAAFHADPADRVVVLFYFSGHSDGEALELGKDRLSFGDLREWLATAGADVRVALVDSCKSGALLAAKGGTPGPAFQIRLTDDVASTGEALLTSSAADEVALESREIGGSFFTHHFISGLRGAADASGDGIVTLNEAYQYAYAHTIKTTGETVIGPQHPAYDYRLSGQGELVLAELTKPTARLSLPHGFERILVADRARDEVIAEVGPDAREVVAVKAGRYSIRAWHAGKIYAGNVSVAMGELKYVRPSDLEPVGSVSTASKGDLELDYEQATRTTAPTIFVAGGITSGVADNLGVVPALRGELAWASGLSLAIEGGSRFHRELAMTFRESDVVVLAGYRRGIGGARWHAWLGAEAGAGVVIQSALMPDTYSTAAAANLVAGASYEIVRGIKLALEPSIGAELLRRDSSIAVLAVPAVWLGLGFAL
ncbi:MAG TPA: caspase family protein [Kofleriaceae bacterium]|nr:caspase family protein [Kofleriaceae bacterium]